MKTHLFLSVVALPLALMGGIARTALPSMANGISSSAAVLISVDCRARRHTMTPYPDAAEKLRDYPDYVADFAKDGDIEGETTALSVGGDVNRKNDDGDTPLVCALDNRRTAMALFLLVPRCQAGCRQ